VNAPLEVVEVLEPSVPFEVAEVDAPLEVVEVALDLSFAEGIFVALFEDIGWYEVLGGDFS